MDEEMTPQETTVEPAEPESFEPESEGRRLVLDELRIQGGQMYMISARVVEMTVESKAGQFQSVRGYVRIAPDNLWIHMPVEPDRLVDESGNIAMLTALLHYVGRALDVEVLTLAFDRLELEAAMAATRRKIERFEIGDKRQKNDSIEL